MLGMDGEMIASIGTSLDTLQEYFNINKDKFRFIALVSPT